MGKSNNAARYVELERKFDAPESGVTPSFDGLAVVSRVEKPPTEHLAAVYFDTANHDLAVNWMTLRRRTGGHDAGWHLKLPAGAARTEIRAPLGPHEDSRAIPETLLDVVRAIVRDRPLMPVARISTERDVTMLYGTDGNPLAEFSNDTVTAARLNPADGSAEAEQQWREWELELVDAGIPDADAILERLANRVLDAGGTPAAHGSKLAKVLGETTPARPEPPSDPVHRAVAEQVAELLAWDRAVRADADDAVHQMRVTIRQIRSLLQASEDEFGLTDDATILSELRELAGVLGIARDAEVLADRYRDALDALPPELVRGPVRQRLVDGGWLRYQAGLARSLKAMRSERYFRLLDALDVVVVSAPPPDDEHPHATIHSAYKRVRNRARAVEEAVDELALDDALHRVRKAAKRLRYIAAATGNTGVSAAAKTIQGLLGDHQDSVVSRTFLLSEASVAHDDGEDTFTFGVLYQREEELAQQCRDQLETALKALRHSVRDIQPE
jgi:CHAD domain-containing protein